MNQFLAWVIATAVLTLFTVGIMWVFAKIDGWLNRDHHP